MLHPGRAAMPHTQRPYLAAVLAWTPTPHGPPDRRVPLVVRPHADEPLPPLIRLTSSRPHRQLPESPNQRAKMAMLQLRMGESRDREGARTLGLSDFGSTAA